MTGQPVLSGVPGELQHAGNLFRLLAELQDAIIREGGDDYSLHRLHEEPDLVTAIARLVVGDVWDFAHAPFDIAVNLHESPTDFYDRTFPLNNQSGLGWFNKAPGHHGEMFFTDPPPSRPCRYILKHYPRRVTSAEVLKEHEPAGYRELVTFVNAVRLKSSPTILALGSPFSYDSNAFIGLHNRTVMKITNEIYCPSCFFLVRVY